MVGECNSGATVPTNYNGKDVPVICEWHHAYFLAFPPDKELSRRGITFAEWDAEYHFTAPGLPEPERKVL